MEKNACAHTGARPRPGRGRRREDLAVVVSHLGELLVVAGALVCLPLLPWWWYGEEGVVPATAFALPAAAALVAGLLARRCPVSRPPDLRLSMMITAAGWLVVSLVGAAPFIFGLDKSFIDAYFEAVSGFTTTGITVFEGLDAMPRCLLFWRSLIQWLGGLGILTFFLAVGARGGGMAASLFGAEGHKISSSRPVPGIFNTVRILWTIYAAFTLASVLAYYLAGMSPFDALNHSLTNISTGGFSTHDESIGFFAAHHYRHAVFIEYATVFFMLAGGMNFLVHYRVACGRVRTLVGDFEMRWYWAIVFGSTGLMVIDHFVNAPGACGLERVARDCLFQVASIVSSTGFATRDINAAFFPALSKQLFLLLMVIGGCVGSTAGGIKVLRVGVLARMFRAQIHRIVAPRGAVAPVAVQGRVLPAAELERIAALLFAWLLLIAAGAGITAFFSPLDAWQSLSGMVSAVGNMGPFYFSVHTMAALGWPVKAVFIVGMLAGRLEILPLAVLFSRSAWK